MEKITRRDMMVKTGAGACALALAADATVLAAADPAEKSIEKFGGFKLGIQSWSLRGFDVEEAIKHAANMGLHWIEFFPRHFRVTDDQADVDKMRELIAPHHISLHAHGVHNLRDNEVAARQVFEFAKLAGIPLISAHPHPNSFPLLDKLVKEYDIRIGIHNHGPNHRYDYIEDSLKAAEPWDERIGFCPDTGHCLRSGEDPVEMIEKMADRLYGIHLKDQVSGERGNPPETILGEGALDLVALCRKLKEIGFNEPLSIEYELKPDNPIADIRKCIANFKAAANA